MTRPTLRPRTARTEPGLLAQAVHILRRDLAVEAATRDAAASVPSFVLVAVVLAGLGFGPQRAVLAAVAPGLVWLLVLTAAVPLARGVTAAELDDDAWDLLRAVTRPAALFLGKTASLWIQAALTWTFGALLVTVLMDARLPPAALAAAALGTLGVAADIVLFGVVLGRLRRPALLSTLVLTAGLPALLAGTQTAVTEDPWPWLLLLVVYDVVTVTTAWATFPVLLDE
ncbi:heme exporter protein CcmB [Pseudonocardia sp. MH-G8]|uniref:heme exporter protein CcmB n=1 Tax=Pseudonocardia sp. MH-G8 TaxID=1854588 RepID=UPI00130409F3|nr:heme exporter protein CcmB [Pseudonocardia sp. MH-G8]